MPTGTIETYNIAESQAEDFADIVYDISPTETPTIMMCGRAKATGSKHEWSMDQLDAAADNALAQSADASYIQAVAVVRMANYCQISGKAVSVSGTAEAVQMKGFSSTLGYQMAKKSKEIKRDMEFTMVGNAPALMLSAAGSAGVAARSAAMQAYFHEDWTTTRDPLPGLHVLRGGGAAASGGFVEATDLFAIPVDGDQRALLETHVKLAMQGAWRNGGNPTCVMAGPYNKTEISAFSGNSTQVNRTETRKLIATFDVMATDFGDVQIIPNRFQRERDVFVLTKELWSINYLRPFFQQALAKTGDAENRQLLVEWTLQGKNHAGSAIIADLATS